MGVGDWGADGATANSGFYNAQHESNTDLGRDATPHLLCTGETEDGTILFGMLNQETHNTPPQPDQGVSKEKIVQLQGTNETADPPLPQPDVTTQPATINNIQTVFINHITKLVRNSILQTPTSCDRIKKAVNKEPSKKKNTQPALRLSPRLKSKNKLNKPVVKLAQEALAVKWGILEDSQALDDLTLKQYIDIYKKPLSVEAMAAISKLTEVASKKKKMKKSMKTVGKGAAKVTKAKKQAGMPV